LSDIINNEPDNLSKELRDEYQDHVLVESVLSIKECQTVLSLIPTLKNNNLSLLKDHEGNVVRNSNLHWLPMIKNNSDWLFKKVIQITNEINDKHYQFDLDGTPFLFQMTKYSKGQYYSWHTDHGPGIVSRRKLSLSICLSSEDEYDGGDIEFFRSFQNIVSYKMSQGSIVVFPSWVSHQVKPVNKGERWSLVAWLEGPPFR
jgi:PKHD-type hydroxylase